jgi:hypothetical protein
VTTVTWRSRGRVTPSDSRTQRHGWAASGSSASRVTLSSNGTTTSHGLYKLEIVVIVDSRVLDLYLYSLINNIQFSSVQCGGVTHPSTRLPPMNKLPICLRPLLDHKAQDTTLWKTQDLVPNLQKFNKHFTKSLKRTQAQGKITLTENGYISQMYTALDHGSILASLNWLLNLNFRRHGGVVIPKDPDQKPYFSNCITKPGSADSTCYYF